MRPLPRSQLPPDDDRLTPLPSPYFQQPWQQTAYRTARVVAAADNSFSVGEAIAATRRNARNRTSSI